MTTTTAATMAGPITARRATSFVSDRRPVAPDLVAGGPGVLALRRQPVVARGGLVARTELEGERLVAASDGHRHCWLPAVAVWSDGEEVNRPEHPIHIGLATDEQRERAVLTGLSDRLGWEAHIAHQTGAGLPRSACPDLTTTCTVFDGRLGHDVPTVLIELEGATRWGCGTTVEGAFRRAMFGDRGTPDATVARELADLELILAAGGIGLAVVDLATKHLEAAGISRVSVQLALPSHDSVRRWDADPMQ